eukprot:765705-Hanusia_phi.AAC.1
MPHDHTGIRSHRVAAKSRAATAASELQAFGQKEQIYCSDSRSRRLRQAQNSLPARGSRKEDGQCASDGAPVPGVTGPGTVRSGPPAGAGRTPGLRHVDRDRPGTVRRGRAAAAVSESPRASERRRCMSRACADLAVRPEESMPSRTESDPGYRSTGRAAYGRRCRSHECRTVNLRDRTAAVELSPAPRYRPVTSRPWACQCHGVMTRPEP